MAEEEKTNVSGESPAVPSIPSDDGSTEDEARKRKMSIDEARALIGKYATRIVEGDEVEYGEVPLHREYFFNPQLVERDLTKFGEGNESQKNVPWQELKRKGVAEGRKAAVWSLGKQTDWDEYLTVAAREYGFLSGRGNKPLAKDLDKALEILKLVAGAEVDRSTIDAEVVRHMESGGTPAKEKNVKPQVDSSSDIDYDNPPPISGGSGLPDKADKRGSSGDEAGATAETESDANTSLQKEIEEMREAMAAMRQMAEDATADKQQAAADRVQAQQLRDAADEKERQLNARLRQELQEKEAEKNAADAAKQKAAPPPSLPSAPKHQSDTSLEQFVGMGTSRMSGLKALRPTVRNPPPSANTSPAPAQEQAPAEDEDAADAAGSE